MGHRIPVVLRHPRLALQFGRIGTETIGMCFYFFYLS